jgi:hypothetical protein
MSQIQTVPWGLQSLLDSQNFGNNPSDFAETLLPVLDQFPLLAANKIFYASIAETFTSAPDGVEIDIPEGELWIPLHLAAGIDFSSAGNVTQSCRSEVVLREAPNQGFTEISLAMSGTETINNTTNTPRRFYYDPPQKKVWWGGSKLVHYFQYTVFDSETIALSLQLEYYKLKI